METKQSLSTEVKAKKVYTKPQIVYQAPMEAVAAACTPVGPGKALIGSCGTLNS